MTTAAVLLEKYSFSNYRTYLAAALFIIGNIAVPQLCHLIPNGGLIFLPIYFFTLVGAFTCGWKVGILTAVLSPVVNCVLFGMPPVASLPAILIKSVTLVVAIAIVAKKMDFSIISVIIAVIAYQLVGMSIEFLMDMNFMHAIQDVRLGWPGILIQIIGGYFAVKGLSRWLES
ncbi:MAG: ECF transporter S component [Bacteroidales bacterium]|nr:ECF transporter S component [Bacteroidales bacterium]